MWQECVDEGLRRGAAQAGGWAGKQSPQQTTCVQEEAGGLLPLVSVFLHFLSL